MTGDKHAMEQHDYAVAIYQESLAPTVISAVKQHFIDRVIAARGLVSSTIVVITTYPGLIDVVLNAIRCSILEEDDVELLRRHNFKIVIKVFEKEDVVIRINGGNPGR